MKIVIAFILLLTALFPAGSQEIKDFVTKTARPLYRGGTLLQHYLALQEDTPAHNLFRALVDELEQKAVQRIEPLLTEAKLFYNEENYEAVIKTLTPVQNTVNEHNPLYALILGYLGNAYYYHADYAQAQTCLQKAEALPEPLIGKGNPQQVLVLDILGALYQKMGDYNTAQAYYLKVKDLLEQPLGKEHPDYAASLHHLGLVYWYSGDYDKAESYLLEAEPIQAQILGKKHLEYARLVNNLGNVYSSMGTYAKAESYYLEAKTIREQSLGEKHLDYAQSVNNLGILYYNMREYTQAEPYYLEARRIYEQTLDKEHPLYVSSLQNLGNLYSSMREYAKAEPYFLEVRQIQEQTLGTEHPDYAWSLNNLGLLYYNMRDYAKAEPYFLEARQIWEQILGTEHPDYAVSLNNLGWTYRNMGEYAKAEWYYLELKQLYEQTLGKEHPDYIAQLHNLANFYKTIGNYAKAEPYLLEARRIAEQTLGTEHPDYAWSLNNLGLLYYNMGDYAKAEPYFLEARQIREQTLGTAHPDYAGSLNTLGLLYKDMGDYAKTESYLLEARRIREKTLGTEHPDYANSLNNLGALYQVVMGEYAKAEPYYLEARRIWEQTLGTEHPDYTSSLNNLGSLYQAMGDYAKAEPYFLEARQIRERTLGTEHPDYAMSLNNLGVLYHDMGEYAKAEPYFLEARRIKERTLGTEHPDYAISLHNLGSLYYDMGEYAKAEPYFLEARQIQEQALGTEHPYYALSLSWLGSLYQTMEDYAKAEQFRTESAELTIRLINRNFSFMSEQQRDSYWNMISRRFESSYSLSWVHPAQSMTALNYSNTLFTKGLLLRTSNAVRDAIYSSGDSNLISQYEQLRSLRLQINALLQKEEPDEAYIQTLETQADALDKALTQASSAFRDLQADMDLQWFDVQQALSPDEAAVEFVSFQLYDKKWTGTTYYAALVLRPGMDAPAWIPLCEQSDLQDLLNRAEGRRADIQARIIYDTFGDALYELIWQPLEQELTGVKTIFYSPAGLLHKVAFNALPAGEYERLSDQYDLNLVSSTREAVHFANNKDAPSQRIGSAVLYGGLEYNTDSAMMRMIAQFYKKEGSETLAAAAPPLGVTRGGAWDALPASREEAVSIQGYLAQQEIPHTLYQDDLGNEESFKQLNGAHIGLLHLATHGFFLTDAEKRREERDESLGGRRGGAMKAIENPLLRSGLILAGGNHAWTNEPVEEVEDGILTAEEIAGLNLIGAELVVMSACQTGLGDVKNSEGVFGLQRAFKLAGVETLIMSLWEVDDAATAKLMNTFYEGWLLEGKGKQEAFKEARRQVREAYPEPFYWAAFVMMD